MVAEQRRMAAHVPASPGVEAGAKPMIIALQLGWWIVVGDGGSTSIYHPAAGLRYDRV